MALPLLMAWSTRLLTGLLILATVAPLVSTGFWMVRLCDFPRIQLAAIACLVMIGVIAIGVLVGWKREHFVLIAVLLGITGWQLSHVLPYTPIWRPEVPSASDRETTRLVVANLRIENDKHEEVAALLRELDADILVLLEIDDRWHRALADVGAQLEHRSEKIKDDGLGIALWSRHPLPEAEIEFLASDDRPSIHVRVQLPDGQVVNVVALHPTPPGLQTPGPGRADSRERDAELVQVARQVADDQQEPWVVAGDFNDVAWSHTTRLFRRISGLNDPRIGRSLLNTYHANHPLLRYPIDHVFVSDGFSIGGLQRRRVPGSDHFAVIADLVLDARQGVDPHPVGDDRQDASEMVREGDDND